MIRPAAPPPRPEPHPLLVGVLVVLFLGACVAVGVGRTHSRFGKLVYNTNAIITEALIGREVELGPMPLREGLEFIVHLTHPRPEDCPDEFIVDWRLVRELDAVVAAEGRLAFDGARYRENPEAPPLAFVPIEVAPADYLLRVAPRGAADFPDLEIYVVEPSAPREVAFILAWCFGSMFLALLAVGVRRHVLAVRVWDRLVMTRARESAARALAGRSMEA